VEGAAHAVALVAGEGVVGVAVGAVAVEQAPAALVVAKEDEVLAEHAHRLQRALPHRRIEGRIELVDQGDRLPIPPQQRAAGRAGADAGDQLVLFRMHGAPPKCLIQRKGILFSENGIQD
jgi:hypothetical protein